MDRHRLGELRSIRYHAAIAARLDAAMIARVRAKLDGWEQAKIVHPQIATAWRALLSCSAEQLAARLVEDSDAMIQLRSSSPFAGELTPQERWQIWRQVAETSTG